METSPGEMSRVVSSEVRAWMARRGLKQADLATALGITRQAVSLRLNGRTAWTIDDLATAAKLLDVPLTTLLSAPEAG